MSILLRHSETRRGPKIYSIAIAWLIGMLSFTPALPSSAGDLRLQLARGPHYVGEAIEIQVIATDFEEDPTPKIEASATSGGSLRFIGVSPSTSTSISIINGKMTRVHEVKFVYRYELTGTREGPLRIPEFRVVQDGISSRTRGFVIEIGGVPTTDLVAIEIDLPDGPIFVGQKVPIALEFRIDRQMQRDLVSYQLHVPLFDSPALRFLDDPLPAPDTHLEVHTGSGVFQLPATSSERSIRGRAALVVRAERTMIAVAPDDIQAEAARVFISRGAGFRRDVFNQRRATSTEKFMTTDRPISIEVAEVPRKNRPASFAGAVGQGFSLEVTADRSVVQLGEPILLSFHLRGDGDLSSASLPPLDAEGLLDPMRFRIPEESPAGIVDENGKHFDVTLRVLDSDVREIPALAYSWFDAGTRRFETTNSRPIALSVDAAEVIGAESVARRSNSGRDSARKPVDIESLPDGPRDRTRRDSSLLLSHANLAVEKDLSQLLRDDRARGEKLTVTLGMYAAGLALLAFAVVDARRRAADPLLVQRARVFRRAEAAMEKAFELSEEEGAAALGRALRELLAALPSEAGSNLDRLISECDTLRFASGSGAETKSRESGPALSESLRERARRLLRDRKNSKPGSPEIS